MFIGREEELKRLVDCLKTNKKTAILIYGKRRIGKSTLICHAAKSFDGVVINHQCIRSSYRGNVIFLAKSISAALDLPEIRFENLIDIFTMLGKQKEKILLVLDEYQYLKSSLTVGEMDSHMQLIFDRLPENVKLILCGSYISVMKELLTEGNPLFGRFTDIIHLKDMNYLDASKFMNGYSIRQKAEAYSVFGGSPYVLSTLDYELSIEDNIKKYLIPENSVLTTYIENVALAEIKNTFDIRILEIIGNGKKKYSEILNCLDMADNGKLDKQLNYLLDMETIRKVYPINKKNDRKKSYYEINDNLMRFYFAMIFGNVGRIAITGADYFYRNSIEPKMLTFISLRFEELVKQFFSMMVKSGKITGVVDVGSYWYDNSEKKENGQFDCVIEYDNAYDIFEVKFYDKPMSQDQCDEEANQIRAIKGLNNIGIGFVCSAGFETKTDKYRYYDLEEIYRVDI